MLSNHHRRGFTLIELLVVITIIAILAGIIFPVYAKTRHRALQASCESNLRQIGNAMMMYCADNDGRMVIYNGAIVRNWTVDWVDLIQPYVRDYKLFHCPADDRESITPYNGPVNSYESTYAVNQFAATNRAAAWDPNYRPVNRDTDVIEPTHTVWVTDGTNHYHRILAYCNTNYSWAPPPRHNDGFEILFVDGHVKWYKWPYYYRTTAGYVIWGDRGTIKDQYTIKNDRTEVRWELVWPCALGR
ncbi:MAG: type II secretion system protein [Armatimonadota bacterium]